MSGMMVFWPKCKIDIIYNSNKSAAWPTPTKQQRNYVKTLPFFLFCFVFLMF